MISRQHKKGKETEGDGLFFLNCDESKSELAQDLDNHILYKVITEPMPDEVLWQADPDRMLV